MFCVLVGISDPPAGELVKPPRRCLENPIRYILYKKTRVMREARESRQRKSAPLNDKLGLDDSVAQKKPVIM